ncbi:acyl-CoA synthetase [Vibrio fluvialis]|nr:acyl-CoA synthetase [Vibrio fluvialis]
MHKIRSLVDIEHLEKVPFEQRLEGLDSSYSVFKRSANLWPDATAITFLPNGIADDTAQNISYADLYANVTRAANLFHSLGIGVTDVVSYMLPNLPQTYYTIWGGQTAGIVNAVNPMLEVEQLASLLNEVSCKVLVTTGPEAGLEQWQKIVALRACVPSLKAILLVQQSTPVDGMLQFDVELAQQPADELLSGRNLCRNDICAYFHTGGTTGTPKIAQHSHANELINAWCGAIMIDIGPKDTLLCGLPLFHVNGVIVTGLAPFMVGSRVLLAGPNGYRNRAMLEQFWLLVEQFRVTIFSAVPTVYSTLLTVPRGEADVSSLRFGICGAAPMPASLIQRFEEATSIRILEGYGLTEGTCVSAINPRDGDRRPGSIGLRLPYQQMKTVILDEQGSYVRDCVIDEIGILVIRGPNIFVGYKQNETNRQLWIDGDWLNTGDMARFDAEGYFWLTGRQKDLIIRGGHNIDPAQIEEALMRHPSVQLAAAVGKPDCYAGELPVAYVELKAGSDIETEELMEYVRRVIPERAAVPTEIFLVEKLPLTAVGKLFKPKLRYDVTEHTLRSILGPKLVEKVSSWQIEVGPHSVYGMQAKINVVTSSTLRQQVTDIVVAIMSGFSLNYELQWQEHCLN